MIKTNEDENRKSVNTMKKKPKNWKSAYDIPFSGLKLGMHEFDFELKQEFFEAYDFEEFRDADLRYAIQMDRKNTMLVFDFQMNGSATVDCDLSLEPFTLPLTATWKLIVKLGSEYRDEDDGVVVIPADEHHFNLADYLYEIAALSIPKRKIHPKVESGDLNTETLSKLREYQIEQVIEEDLQDESESEMENDAPLEDSDPRWQKLKDIYKNLN